MALDLLRFQEEVNREGIMFCYSGPISQSTIEGIGATLRLNMEIAEAGNRTAQTVFLVFVEQMQNILNYSAEILANQTYADKELRRGILVISNIDNFFLVYCGNRIFNKDVEPLQARIDEVMHLDKQSLKELYMERIRLDPHAGSKGAGLGLIDMARRSGKPIEYDFTRIDDTYSFFSIKVSVGG